MIPHPRQAPPGADQPFPYEWSGNTAAVVGIIFCLVILWIWYDRDTAYFRKGERQSDSD